jgi:hypothetical protein
MVFFEAFSLDILDPDAAPLAQALSRFLNAELPWELP